MLNYCDTDAAIAAVATPAGAGAAAIIRLSGRHAHSIADAIFVSKSNKKLAQQLPYTMHYGSIVHDGKTIDEVLAAVFRSPHSYTGEDTIEIYCHGSAYIQQEILHALLQNGARMAQAGEFTLRAFLNKKIDMAQAEGVNALIAARTAASHRIAMQQMRGGYSQQIKRLRAMLLDFGAMLELELDFGEEDVEFASRQGLLALISEIMAAADVLLASFAAGNAIRHGIPVAICGKPNAGKSTLFNALVSDDRALVSPIAGTTRDAIEDTAIIGGILFRFADTAGLRASTDMLENMGIERSRQMMQRSSIILWAAECMDEASVIAQDVCSIQPSEHQRILVLLNKSDLLPASAVEARINQLQSILGADAMALGISAKDGAGMQALRERIVGIAAYYAADDGCIVSNARHYDALLRASAALKAVKDGIENGISSDIAAFELRTAADAMGEITGEITTEDMLSNIFGKFCIGK